MRKKKCWQGANLTLYNRFNTSHEMGETQRFLPTEVHLVLQAHNYFNSSEPTQLNGQKRKHLVQVHNHTHFKVHNYFNSSEPTQLNGQKRKHLVQVHNHTHFKAHNYFNSSEPTQLNGQKRKHLVQVHNHTHFKIEKMAAVLAPGDSPSGMRREARFSRTVSMHGRNENWIQHPAIARSRSAPELLEDVRIIPTVEADTTAAAEEEEEEEDVCRICMVGFEGAEDTFTLECGCKGELSLTHKECTIKWFSMKGDRNCEVCKQDIMNLPLIFPTYRVWKDAPILLIVSIALYICFLTILWGRQMRFGALVLSVPFGSLLGLLGSMISTTMVRRRYALIYAAAQFMLVVVFALIFYSKLHMPGILSAFLGIFAGFGGAMCGAFILYSFLKWRDNQLRETRRRSLEGTRVLAI
ncbi:zinc finger, RING-CH-type, Zinc finger, RING/FYVE/PHD-type [Artemisia annua]|uniref:Zinc finger, RING-CH-type, Zinc finger, RING/FYVE/PHD-type n=1 Tax=Artemisia annua TaxID=35608 RepID=A0A2U1QBK4_ARTAN|nr:zinc finger, RING-CH-type, Zinc finger, RING/FYVE/PHD-type [Artemisia annua]